MSEVRKAPFPRRKRGDAGTRIFLAVFLAGYVFFLSSNLWMPVSGNAERLTPIGQTSEYEGRRVTLISWTYGTSQEEMEVEIDVVNRRFDGIDTYAFSAVEQKALSEDEIEDLDEDRKNEQLAIYWCAKEAIYKLVSAYPVDFAEQIEVERFRPRGEGELDATFIHKDGYEEDFELEYITFDNHVLVWVVG